MGKLRADVAIIGGGPAGSTVGTLLRKYNPELRIVILERECFPRDHVGESQVPAIGHVLAEMGVWEKVEAANFPIKMGGTFRWGATDELWHLNFIPPEDFLDRDRPTPYDYQRRSLAFQVDRSIYDNILLDHAKSMGCQVYEAASVREVKHEGDFITGLEISCAELGGNTNIEAEYYVDASGEGGIARRALGIKTEVPTALRNIAFWDYWRDAEWAETIGRGATRIQVMSLGWGWLWFIPISSGRTSIGLVLPAEYYKQSGKRPEELYKEAIAAEPLISSLVRNATCENHLMATKDWNFLAERLAGENWFMAGDSCGFADPILSLGMTLAHYSGLRTACSLLELFRANHDPQWIRDQYSEGHRSQILRHMRFAEFWYAGNGRFTDLKEHCATIASTSGLKLNPDEAFFWLGTGGFALDQPGAASLGSYPLSGVKALAEGLTGGKSQYTARHRRLRLNTEGASSAPFAFYNQGTIREVACLSRNGKQLPLVGLFALVYKNLVETEVGTAELIELCSADVRKVDPFFDAAGGPKHVEDAIEAMLLDGWVTGDACTGSAPNSNKLQSALSLGPQRMPPR